MKTIRNVCLLVLVMAMCLAFTGIGAAFAQEGAAITPEERVDIADSDYVRATAEGTLTIGTLDAIGAFDTMTSSNFIGKNMVYEPLFYMGDDNELIMCLAESYEYVDDSHLHIVLRDDATFSNGETVTSEDCYWSWLRMMDSGEVGQYNYIDFENWENESDKEFTIAFYSPFAPAINYMANYYVVCKSAMEDAEADAWWNSPVGSGPYVLTENVEDAYMTFELNEDYWNADLMPDGNQKTVTIKKYGSSTSMMIDFQTGAIDGCINVDASDAQRVRAGVIEDANYELYYCDYVYYLAFPEYTEAVSDIRVRQALNYAIDKEALVMVAFGDLATIATSAVPMNALYSKQYDVVEYNPELAKELLAEAGVDGLSLTVYYDADNLHDTLWQLIQAYWAEVGVTLNLNSCDRLTFIQHMINQETDLGIYNGSPYGLDPHVFLQCTATSSNPMIRFTDEAFNDAIETAASTLDESVRQECYETAQDVLVDTFKNIYIAEPMQMNVWHSYISNFVNGCSRNYYIRFVEWAE